MTILEFLGFGLALLFLLSCFMLLRAGIKIVVNDKLNKSPLDKGDLGDLNSPLSKSERSGDDAKGVRETEGCKKAEPQAEKDGTCRIGNCIKDPNCVTNSECLLRSSK